MELYCIKHGKMYHAEDGVCGLGHMDVYPVASDLFRDDVDYDLDFCCFPLGFAYCAHPEAPDMDLILFDRPYLDDLLEYQEQVEQAVGELLFELNVMEV